MGTILPNSIAVVAAAVRVYVCRMLENVCTHVYDQEWRVFVVAIQFAEKLIPLENKSCSFDKRPTALIIRWLTRSFVRCCTGGMIIFVLRWWDAEN